MMGQMQSFVPAALRRRGAQRVLADGREHHDATLVRALAKGFYWRHLVDTGVMRSGAAIARAEGAHPAAVNELIRLTLLAPDIIERLLAGHQPRGLTLWWFQHNPLPSDWVAQRAIMARFEERP
ncbi:site-specific recombinase resolvase [Ralstonia sp.]|uniref:site-specific recombinase resolvase n=1 Tax=Ralstonia sp. TaxID=54061 RepID=UPI0031D5BB89